MKRIGYMCVALGALFVLDSHGAGVADWSVTARQSLESYATAKVTASDADVKDTQDRWDKSEAINANVRITETEIFVDDTLGLQPVSEETNDGWTHTTLVDGNGNPVLEYDTYGDTIVITRINLAGYSVAINYENIFFLGDATCESLTLAARNSVVCVSNDIEKISDFLVLTHNGVIAADIPGFADLKQIKPEAENLPKSLSEEQVRDSENLKVLKKDLDDGFSFTDRVISPVAPRNTCELFGRFIQKCPTWLPNGLSKNRTISIFGLNAANKDVESKGVKINLMGNIKVNRMINGEGSTLAFGEGLNTEFAYLGLYFNPQLSYECRVYGNDIIPNIIPIEGFVGNRVLNSLHEKFFCIYDYYNNAKSDIYPDLSECSFGSVKRWKNRRWVHWSQADQTNLPVVFKVVDNGKNDRGYKFKNKEGQPLDVNEIKAVNEGSAVLDDRLLRGDLLKEREKLKDELRKSSKNEKLEGQFDRIDNASSENQKEVLWGGVGKFLSNENDKERKLKEVMVEIEQINQDISFRKQFISNPGFIDYERVDQKLKKKDFSKPEDVFYYEFFYAKTNEESKPCSWAVDFALSDWMMSSHTNKEITDVWNGANITKK